MASAKSTTYVIIARWFLVLLIQIQLSMTVTQASQGITTGIKEKKIMTASQQAKAAGLKSLRQASQILKQSERTLYDWHKNKPDVFAAVLIGAKAAADAIEAEKKAYEGEPHITAEQLDEIRYRIQSEINGHDEQNRFCKQSKFDSGERAGLEKALEIIAENQTDDLP